jgi:glycosyltransferase involved in cell wall biosynthesis
MKAMKGSTQLQAAPDELPKTVARLQEQLKAVQDQLHDLQQREQSWNIYRHWRWRQILKKVFGVQLCITPQHQPRSLSVPQWYTQAPEVDLPRVSIVTPSYNQGGFLERTIRSVLEQRYPKLEYIIQDGGSSDETAQILARYRHLLTHCESIADRGQAHALNLGFRHTTGEILCYLNSDDLLLPSALHYVGEYFVRHSEVDVVYGHRILIDENDREVGRWVLPPHDDGVLSWADYVPQETLFWRRRIWEKAGGAFDETFQFALDWDLILRFRDAGARFARLPRFLGGFRLHPGQKTATQLAHLGYPEMSRLRERCHGRPVTYAEISWHIARYLVWHVVYQRLYQLGLLRY